MVAPVVLRISDSTAGYFEHKTIKDWRWLMSALHLNGNDETGRQSVLERAFIREYLLNKGFYLVDLETMSEEDSKLLMIKACRNASLKLAELESRAKFRQQLHEIRQR
jgi:hypothetical protein